MGALGETEDAVLTAESFLKHYIIYSLNYEILWICLHAYSGYFKQLSNAAEDEVAYKIICVYNIF